MNHFLSGQKLWQHINEWLILLTAALTLLGWQTRSQQVLFFIMALNISVWVLTRLFLPQQPIHPLPRELWWFLGWISISSLFSTYFSHTLFELVKIINFLLLAVVVAGASSDAFREKLFSLIVSLGITGGIIGIYDFFQLSSPFAGVAATFGWRNIYAGWLLLIIPITVTLALTRQTKNWQVPSFIASTLALTMLFLTFSQAAWIAALLTLVLLISVFFRWKIPGLTKKLFGLLGAATVLCVFLVWLHGAIISPQNKDSFTDSANISAVSLNNRLDYWSSTLAMIQQHPLIGVGLGNFATHYPRYQHNLWTFTSSPHNSLLLFAAETGVIGAILWIFFLGSVLQKIIISSKKLQPRDKIMTAALCLALLASFLHSLFDFDWEVPGVWLLWWLELGVLLSLITPHKNYRSKKTLVIITGLIFALYLMTHSISADSVEQTRLLLNESIAAPISRQSLHKNTILAPENADTWQLLADNARLNILTHQGDREQEAYDLWRYSQRAVQLEPDSSERHFQQGVNLALITNRDDPHIYEAEQALQKAVELDPWNHPQYYLQLALFYTRLGENEKALLTCADALNIYTEEALKRLFLDAETLDLIRQQKQELENTRQFLLEKTGKK